MIISCARCAKKHAMYFSTFFVWMDGSDGGSGRQEKFFGLLYDSVADT